MTENNRLFLSLPFECPKLKNFSSTMIIRIYHLFYILCFTPLEGFASPNFQSFSAANPFVGATKILGKTLIGDDGIIFSCSGKNIYAFNGNGTIVWSVHLNYYCNLGLDLAYGGKTTIYLVAENKVLKIDFMYIGTSQPVFETFFDPRNENITKAEIIALSSSMITSSVFVSINNGGLYVYSFSGKLRWKIDPVVYSLGYRQSCWNNVTDCFFTSGPVIDHCEASIYISNNQGELLSLSIHSPKLKWIQDFSSFDSTLTITPGNNGHLYVTLPAKALVFSLAVSTGDILWQKSIGPLSSLDYKPVVDSNGWISIGSLDGYMYSISPTGDINKFSKGYAMNNVVQANPFLDCSGFAVYCSYAEMEGKRNLVSGDFTFVSAVKPKNVFFTLLVPATGYVYWSETYPGVFSYNVSESDLKHFVLNEAIFLAFIAASNVGNPIPCKIRSRRIAPTCAEHRTKRLHVYTSNERSILLFLLFETIILVILAITARFCCVFWGKRKIQNKGLGQFLEKRRSFRLMKKEYDRSITELEHKAVTGEEEEASTAQEFIDKLSDLVKEREDLEHKLSTTYSLGRDLPKLQRSKSMLPLYDGRNARSYSFQSERKESVTIFHGHTDSDCSSSYEGESENESIEEERAVDDVKGKQIYEEESCSCSCSCSSSDGYYVDSDGEYSEYGFCGLKL